MFSDDASKGGNVKISVGGFKHLRSFTFPPLDEEEWEMAINGLWPEGGQVPKQWKGSEFEVWNKIKT